MITCVDTEGNSSEAQPLRVFQTDPSWYEDYWYGAEPPAPPRPIRHWLPALASFATAIARRRRFIAPLLAPQDAHLASTIDAAASGCGCLCDPRQRGAVHGALQENQRICRPSITVVLSLVALLIAILQAAGQVSAQEPHGVHGKGHGKLHHWYKTLRQPGTGYACCDDKDCRPTTARVRGRTIEVLVDGEWTRVPPNTILKRRSRDLNTHVCAPRGPWSPKPIFCVVLGLGV